MKKVQARKGRSIADWVVVIGLIILVAWRIANRSSHQTTVLFNESGEYQATIDGKRMLWPVGKGDQGVLTFKYDDGTCEVYIGDVPAAWYGDSKEPIYIRLPCDQITAKQE
jgi:hypothetical protein